VRLADHRISADAAQFVGDLARRHAFAPQLLELIDAFIGPGHRHSFLPLAASGCRD
jgi:hypothetical protein